MKKIMKWYVLTGMSLFYASMHAMHEQEKKTCHAKTMENLNMPEVNKVFHFVLRKENSADSIELLEDLLQLGASSNKSPTPFPITNGNHCCYAACNKPAEFMKLLLKYGASIDGEREYSTDRQRPCIKLAKMLAEDRQNFSPFLKEHGFRNLGIVLERGADTSIDGGEFFTYAKECPDIMFIYQSTRNKKMEHIDQATSRCMPTTLVTLMLEYTEQNPLEQPKKEKPGVDDEKEKE